MQACMSGKAWDVVPLLSRSGDYRHTWHCGYEWAVSTHGRFILLEEHPVPFGGAGCVGVVSRMMFGRWPASLCANRMLYKTAGPHLALSFWKAKFIRSIIRLRLVTIIKLPASYRELWRHVCCQLTIQLGRSARVRYVASWEFTDRASWGNGVRSGSENTHGLDLIRGFAVVPSQKYTCPLYGVPDYRSSIEQKASICRDIKLQLSCWGTR